MSDQECAQEIADEVVGAFSKLNPKIHLPYDAWQTLHEMIEAECLYHYSDGKLSATAIAENKLYIAAAIRSGLRETADV
jgi:hypothetical protein